VRSEYVQGSAVACRLGSSPGRLLCGRASFPISPASSGGHGAPVASRLATSSLSGPPVQADDRGAPWGREDPLGTTQERSQSTTLSGVAVKRRNIDD
jgi:hypothetical protein